MNREEQIRKIVTIAILGAFVACLQLFSNYIQFGQVSITLALIPIVIGAIIYGPAAGFILGLIDGVMCFIAPSTIQLFWPYSILKTLILCLFKTSIAGLLSGVIYNIFKKKTFVATFLAAIIVPLANTGIFTIGMFTLFSDIINSFNPNGKNIFIFFIVSFIGINFVIEFAINSLLSPAIIKILELVKKDE